MNKTPLILMVDDQPLLRRAAVRLLDSSGYQIIEAGSGQECLNLAREHQPDLILLDVVLPDIGGLEVCRQIKATPQLAHILIVLLSGLKTASDEQIEGYELGADDYIVRPVNNRELLVRVRAMLRIKQAEETLRESEERYRSLIEISPDPILVTDLKGNILICNLRTALTHGYGSVAELVGKNAFELITPEDQARAVENVKKVLQQGILREVKYNLLKKDGTVFPAELNVSLITDQDGNPQSFIGIIRDVSGRQQVEAALERRAAQLALINDIGGKIAAVLELDKVLDRTVHLIRENFDYHHVALFTVDHNQNELVMRTRAGDFSELFPPDHRLKIGQGMVGWVFEQGQTLLANNVKLESRHFNPYPEVLPTQSELTVPIQSGGEIVGMLDIQSAELDAFDQGDVLVMETLASQVAIAIENARLHQAVQQELLERTRTEKILRDEKALMDALLDNIPDSIYFKDLECRLIRANRKMLQDLNLAEMDQIIGKTDTELFGPEFGAKTLATDRQVLDSGQPVVGLIEQRVLNDGQANWTLTTKAPLRDGNGQIQGLVGITREINELVQAEKQLRTYSEQLAELVAERTKELEEAQAALIRKERLAVLGQLSGGIAHELRNPMGAIKNAAYFLNMALNSPDAEVQEALEILNKEVNASERIIGNLLDFARATPPAWQMININKLLQQTLTHHNPPDNIKVVCHADESLLPIQADPDQLGVVFTNIIYNAIQAMADGGQLTVATRAEDAVAVITITDTGLGISKENMGKLFEPLFTTKTKGIGLGLALVKTLVQAHHGTIEVASEIGQGSSFTIKLPVNPAL